MDVARLEWIELYLEFGLSDYLKLVIHRQDEWYQQNYPPQVNL